MQRQSRRYSFARRLFFPYSGEDALTPTQGLRVILVWALLLPILMSIMTLVITLLGQYPPNRVILLLVITFLSGVAIFGSLGCLVVYINNLSARMRQRGRIRRTDNTSGGRYGS